MIKQTINKRNTEIWRALSHSSKRIIGRKNYNFLMNMSYNFLVRALATLQRHGDAATVRAYRELHLYRWNSDHGLKPEGLSKKSASTVL